MTTVLRGATAIAVLAELRNAPATAKEIAAELGILQTNATTALRTLYKDGRITRRSFYIEGDGHTKYLYMLHDHAPKEVV